MSLVMYNGTIVNFGGKYVTGPLQLTYMTVQFTSEQPATKSQITLKYKVPVGKSVYLNWGYGSDILLTADGAEKTIVSAFPTANMTYNCIIYGDINYLQEFYVYNNTTFNIASSELAKFRRIEYLYLYYSSSDNGKLTINSSDLKYLTNLKKLTLRTLSVYSVFNTADLSQLPIEEIDVQAAPTLSNYICNSADLTAMPLTSIVFSANAGTFNFFTSDIFEKNLTKFNITGYGSTSIIRSLDFKLMTGLLDIFIHGGFSSSIIDSADFINLPLTRLDIGHTGVNTIIRSSDVKQIKTLTNFTLYGNGGTYIIDLSDFSAMSNLLTFYMNGQVSPISISGGKLSDLPTQLVTMFFSAITGLDIATGAMKAWTNTTITLTNAHPSADVDAFLIAYAPVAGTAAKVITIKNIRTSASDSAVAVLQGKLKTVNTSN